MTPLLFAAICIAGGVGANLRFLIDGLVRARTRTTYPLGTTIINVTGSLLLGAITALGMTAALSDEYRLVIGVGLLGGYTTFSTASFETIRLAQQRRVIAAVANGVGMLVISVAAAAAGYALTALASGP
ncbi:fluoride efflux transporter CrcB [Cumulibacter manganitolerans]|uniref:fluoride efflux transporter CrcB n=1 Tax=Cumulibacter manganitolerans TaxID=1884992 RepID=UPI001296E0EA|nr:fluoride efflux transporter CrcB [Cumulibacter manganitolerans]